MRSLIFVLVAAGCGAPPLGTQAPPPGPCSGDVLCIHQPPRRDKADLLFVLDDGPTMGAKLDAFRAALPSFLARLDDAAQLGAPVSYHLGVVTADLGAGPQANTALGCRPGGDGAKLRASGDMSGGVRYIDDNQLNGTSNVPDVAATLAAITDVGTAGCEFRQPLEAAYRALHDQLPENAGFLRSDAVLAVFFVTDADDCSAPTTTDLFDAGAAYGPLVPFRCTQFGIACNGMPVPPTPVVGLTGCVSQTMADGGKLIDLDEYIAFFTTPAAQGGVKVDPAYAILAGLMAPKDPVGVTITSPCADDASIGQCATLSHSCMSATDPRFFGDPAVRLASVVASARNNALMSVCDADDTQALRSLADLLFARTASACLPQPVANRADGTPDCVAEELTALPDGTTSTTEIPSCAENGDTPPCWRLVDHLADYDAQNCATASPTCTLPASCVPVTNPLDGTRQLYTVTIDGAIPPATTTRVSCATP